eukprot:scaffold11401_cov55-Phaeocystis_antarctica.AAC.3
MVSVPWHHTGQKRQVAVAARAALRARRTSLVRPYVETKEGGSDSGQLDLRRPVPRPQRGACLGLPQASASLGGSAGWRPRWPATQRPWFRHI